MVLYFLNETLTTGTPGVDHGCLRNIARYKPTNQSSTYQYYKSSYAVDGDVSTFAHVHLYNSVEAEDTQPSSIMSWEVNFQGTFNISHFVIVPRSDCCHTRFRSFEIRFFDDLDFQVGYVAMPRKPHLDGNLTHYFTPNILGSRAVVSKDSNVANDHFHFSEFEVYGAPPQTGSRHDNSDL